MPSQMRLDKSMVDEIEINISPPLAFAITIPVTGTNIVVYVGVSAFLTTSQKLSGREDIRLIADGLELNLKGLLKGLNNR